jgi:hypothetical protein
MTKYPMWLIVGAVVLGVIAALLFVVPQAPVSERQGTAASVLDTQRSTGACADLPDSRREQAGETATSRTAASSRGSGPDDPASGTTKTPPSAQ